MGSIYITSPSSKKMERYQILPDRVTQHHNLREYPFHFIIYPLQRYAIISDSETDVYNGFALTHGGISFYMSIELSEAGT
jgi:hypothetical protein